MAIIEKIEKLVNPSGKSVDINDLPFGVRQAARAVSELGMGFLPRSGGSREQIKQNETFSQPTRR